MIRNRLDPNRPDYRDARLDTGPGMNWNWILGGIAVVVVLLIALSYMGGERQTAGTDRASPPATTGQSAPRIPPATTGQSSPTQASPTQSSTPNMAPTSPTPSPSPKQ